MNRRTFGKWIGQASLVGMGAALLDNPLGAWLKKTAQQISRVSENTFGQLLTLFGHDKIDRNLHYAASADFSLWHQEIHHYFREVLPHLNVPEEGAIVELGVFNGQSSAILKSIFGPVRYLGIDAVKRVPDDHVYEIDVRDMGSQFDQPIAFGWNDISTWAGSPRSRRAASDFIRRNLLIGGYYLEEGLSRLPADFSMEGLEIVHSAPLFTVFKRIS